MLARESSSDIPSLGEHKRPQMRLQVNFQGVLFFTGVWGTIRNGHFDTVDMRNFSLGRV